MLKIKTYGKKHKKIHVKENLSNYQKFKTLISKTPALGSNSTFMEKSAAIDSDLIHNLSNTVAEHSTSPAAELHVASGFNKVTDDSDGEDLGKSVKESVSLIQNNNNHINNLQKELQEISINPTKDKGLPKCLDKAISSSKHKNSIQSAENEKRLSQNTSSAKTLPPEKDDEESEEYFDAVNHQEDWDASILSAEMSRLYTAEEISYASAEKSISDLLILCNQNKILEFGEFFSDSYPTRKIGEASYSDVFQDSRQAIKIIPLGVGDQLSIHAAWLEIASTVKVGSIIQESGELVARHFVKIQRMGIVSGRYPKILVDQFDLYDEKNGSENIHPSTYASDQVYLILCLDFAGSDLEHSTLLNNSANAHSRVTSLLLQVIISLGQAEDQISFEHRDLHLGNVLISSTKTKSFDFDFKSNRISVPSASTKVCIIDFALSRFECDQTLVYNDLEQDPDIFTGQGDIQFDIYRMMQDHVDKDWSLFSPKTNVFWIHFLIKKLSVFVQGEVGQRLERFADRLLVYKSCADVVEKEVVNKRGFFYSECLSIIKK